MKYLLMIAAAALVGCESAQVVRQREMTEARSLTAALNVSPEQQAYAAAQIYQGMEAERNANLRTSAAIVANGFNNAGAIIANSSRYQPNYIQPIQYNVQPMQIPTVHPAPLIPVSRY
jgi:hypothetical protein